jgi:hypothetical protein
MTFNDIFLFLFMMLSVLLLIVIITHEQNIGNLCVNSKNKIIKCAVTGELENMNNLIRTKPFMWVYWELVNKAKSPPPYINLCMDIMKKNGSKYFIVIFLNERNIFEYIPDLRKDINDLPIALKTDYIRVKLLSLYGGLWVDADTILMNNLKTISEKLNNNIDYIGFGCTGSVCKDQEGYGRPSNGVIGSQKNGKLISRCLKALDHKLNEYYSIPKNKRKEFNYFDLGKMIIWSEYDKLIREDPDYKMYHVPSYSDGTRDANGKWIAKILIFKNDLKYSHRDKLMVVMLANSSYCGNDPEYNWFCKLSREQILNGDYFISGLFRDAMKYDPYAD